MLTIILGLNIVQVKRLRIPHCTASTVSYHTNKAAITISFTVQIDFAQFCFTQPKIKKSVY